LKPTSDRDERWVSDDKEEKERGEAVVRFDNIFLVDRRSEERRGRRTGT
jgi:hypothetical protein